MNILQSGILLLTIIVAAGCAGAKTVTTGSGIPGEREFRANCVSCHSLPGPDEQSDEQWKQIIDSHGKMIGLEPDTQAAILKFLQEHNSDNTRR